MWDWTRNLFVRRSAARRRYRPLRIVEALEARLVLDASPASVGLQSMQDALVPTAAAVDESMGVELVGAGFSSPTYVTSAPGETDRLFVLEKNTGRIEILHPDDGSIEATAFLDLDVSTSSEQGLLGMAFDPDYDTNGFFYVNYTDPTGTTVVSRFTVSADPDVADASSERILLKIAQPQANHNGGWLGFGPDGHLYIGVGDGGGSNDQGTGHTADTGNAQDITSNLLGKILRIDPSGDAFPSDPLRNYAIPSDNPFVGTTGDDEIWSFGLRNPWRASFDRLTGDLYIGDVGQGAREEIDFQPADSDGGENYGWRLREGDVPTPGVGGNPPAGHVPPIYDYLHGSGDDQGNSVTGGYVYRGPIESLQGQYFFGDFVNGRIWSLEHDGATATEFLDWTDTLAPASGSIGNVASFGEDGAGNLYIVDFDGEIYRVVQTGAVNQPPTVSAGPDANTVLPDNQVALNGTVSDDGLPGPTVTTTWSVQSGPGSVTFGNAGAVDTTATFGAAGTYVLRLTANDGQLQAFDEVSITVQPAPTTTIGETGRVTVDQPNATTWRSVTFANAYVDPVVVMGPPSTADGAAATVRVRNVTSTGFQFQIDEWDYLDGAHATETIGWMVVEAGTHTLDDGTVIQAKKQAVDQRWSTVGFGTAFSATPVVLAQVATTNEATAVTTRMRNAAAGQIQLRLQEQQSFDKNAATKKHLAETVHVIAIEAGAGDAGGLLFEAGRTPDAVRHKDYALDFAGTYAQPVFLAAMQTTGGGDTAALRYRTLTGDGATIFVEEEQSGDAETNHTTEVVGYLVFAGPGEIAVASGAATAAPSVDAKTSGTDVARVASDGPVGPEAVDRTPPAASEFAEYGRRRRGQGARRRAVLDDLFAREET